MNNKKQLKERAERVAIEMLAALVRSADENGLNSWALSYAVEWMSCVNMASMQAAGIELDQFHMLIGEVQNDVAKAMEDNRIVFSMGSKETIEKRMAAVRETVCGPTSKDLSDLSVDERQKLEAEVSELLARIGADRSKA